MLPEESGLFEVRFNEEGKRLIRKFVAISYTILGLVIVECVGFLYWSVKTLFLRISFSGDPGYKMSTFDRVYPYISIILSLLALTSNIYYTQFPRQLHRSIRLNDEAGANRSFKTLFNGAIIFLIWLFLNCLTLVWSLFIRQS